MLWDGTYGFSTLSEKLESLAISRCHYKGSTFFLLSYLKTMGVGQAGVRTRDLPFTRPFSPNWANQATVLFSFDRILSSTTPE